MAPGQGPGGKAAAPRPFAGTPTYCSLFAHSGGPLRGYDDIEAMVRAYGMRLINVATEKHFSSVLMNVYCGFGVRDFDEYN